MAVVAPNGKTWHAFQEHGSWQHRDVASGTGVGIGVGIK